MSIAQFLATGSTEYTRGFVMATLSHIAYDTNSAHRQQRFRGVGLEEIAAVECEAGGLTGLEAYVLTRGNDIVIAIRGTQGALDIATDLDLTKMRVGRILVHRGFARSALRFMDAFRLRQNDWPPFDHVWVTGHSLGGAVGQVVGYLLHQMGEEVTSVTSFGSPRVGGLLRWRNVLRDEAIVDRYVRWVNHNDIVPTQPVLGRQPRNWLWKHVGTQHLIDTDEQTISLSDDTLLWPTRLSGGDHSISGFEAGDDSGYIRSLLSFMPEPELALLKGAHASSLVSTMKDCERIAEIQQASRLTDLPAMQRLPASLRSAALSYL